MPNPNFKLVTTEIETPLVNAAGSINGTSSELILREVETLADTAIGAITVGSFTVPEQLDNEVKFGSPTYYHDRETGSTYNSMGLPNIGLDAAKRLMPEVISRAWDKGKPVIASVSPTQSSPENGGNAFEQVKQLVEGLLETEAD
jgi:dihydroorotate dehydrogenase